ncbi:MAG: WecB/TagA/CpsF family glycosyltransferase [bacterium]
MKKISIFGTEVNDFTQESLTQELKDCFAGQKRRLFAKVNTEFLLRARQNSDFTATLNSFDYKIADGIGVLWAAKFLSIPTVKTKTLRVLQILWQWIYTSLSLLFYPKYVRNPIPERIPGVDCLYLMLEAAINTDSSVYLFGAEKEVLATARCNLEDKYPKLRIVGSHDGYDYTDKEIIDDINRLGVGLLIVALGSPKQEYWIRDNISKLTSVRVAVGEGGSFDFVAGTFRRAPKWMQRIGLEWLWRLFMNKSKTQTGSRMKRIWQAVPVFMYAVVKSKINNNV